MRVCECGNLMAKDASGKYYCPVCDPAPQSPTPEAHPAETNTAGEKLLTGILSIPPEQRATTPKKCRPFSQLRAERLQNPEVAAAFHAVEAAHPEAVRIELPPLDALYHAVRGERKCGGIGAGVPPEYDQLCCRERQLLATLTELQTERSAHERTRTELEKEVDHYKYACEQLKLRTFKCIHCQQQVPWDEVYRCYDCGFPYHKDCLKSHIHGSDPRKYLCARRMEAELESLRAELAALKS